LYWQLVALAVAGVVCLFVYDGVMELRWCTGGWNIHPSPAYVVTGGMRLVDYVVDQAASLSAKRVFVLQAGG